MQLACCKPHNESKTFFLWSNRTSTSKKFLPQLITFFKKKLILFSMICVWSWNFLFVGFLLFLNWFYSYRKRCNLRYCLLHSWLNELLLVLSLSAVKIVEYVTTVVSCLNMFCLILPLHMLKKQKVAYKIRVFNTEWANKYLDTFTRYKIFCFVYVRNMTILRQFTTKYAGLSKLFVSEKEIKESLSTSLGGSRASL
jgi:hypothetical protein